MKLQFLNLEFKISKDCKKKCIPLIKKFIEKMRDIIRIFMSNKLKCLKRLPDILFLVFSLSTQVYFGMLDALLAAEELPEEYKDRCQVSTFVSSLHSFRKLMWIL